MSETGFQDVLGFSGWRRSRLRRGTLDPNREVTGTVSREIPDSDRDYIDNTSPIFGDQASKTGIEGGYLPAALHSGGYQKGIGNLAVPLDTRHDLLWQFMN